MHGKAFLIIIHSLGGVAVFAFEGLGSIYWHMISKLLLAVQECALTENIPTIKNQLLECYEDIRLGLGFTKTADVYGAFPTDAYSHSPRHIRLSNQE